MSSNQDMGSESSRQQQIDILLATVAKLVGMGGPSAPAIVANGLYTSAQVQENLGVSDVTVAAWVEFNGLAASQPGTSKHLFYGQHLIDFVLKNKAGIVKPKSAKEKAALRKANGNGSTARSR
mgnify:FL=1